MKTLSSPAQKFYDYLTYDKNPRTAHNYTRNADAFLRFVNKPLEKVAQQI